MEQWAVIAGAVVSVFAVAAAGAGARRLGWLTEQADQSLLRLVVQVLFPCLIFSVVVGSPQLTNARNVFLPPLVGVVTEVMGFALALALGYGLGRLSGLQDPVQLRTFAVCVGIYNYGYVPIPLINLLFPPAQAQDILGVLFVHNVGVELALWTVGVLLLAGELRGKWWLKAINVPSITIVVALTLNFLHLDRYVPTVLIRAAAMLGAAAIPMALVLIGATIADHLRWDSLTTGKRVVFWACVLRLGLLPVCFLLLAKVTPGSPELLQVMVVEAAMPAAVFPIVLARHYGGHPPTALRVVLGTSLLSLITTPLWLALGMRYLGLGPPG